MVGTALSKALWRFVFVSFLCLRLVSSSYLDFPRLNFAGKFRADVSTFNNIQCNYNLAKPLNGSWNPNGTGEFYFFNTTITSAVYENGTVTEDDPVVNSFIVNNLLQPLPKLVDVDTDAQIKSTIYGMTLFIVSDSKEANPTTPILKADWVRSVIAYDVWHRLLCSNGGDPVLSAQATSKLENVVWGNTSGSVALEQLQRASEMGTLSVRITHYRITSSYRIGNFTFGQVVGTIGISRPFEPLNAGGQRLLSYQDVPFARINVSQTDSCFPNVSNKSEQLYWAYKAPFKVNESSAVLSVDLSNALAMDLHGNLRDLGRLQFAVYLDHACCMELIGSQIDYLEDGWLRHTGGIADVSLREDQLERLRETHLNLVLVSSTRQGNQSYEVCEGFPSLRGSEFVQVLLKELRFFIRPMDYFVYRLQRTYNDTAGIDLFVTDFGIPAINQSVNLTLSGKPIPLTGILPRHSTILTNSRGVAMFTLQLNNTFDGRIPYPRQYAKNTTECGNNITIDGQIYHYSYSVNGSDDSDICIGQAHALNSHQFVFCQNFVTILAHSDPYEFNYTEPYTWIDHVQPIFQQYYELYPVMSTILNMSNYSNVILPHNINLLRYAMNRSFDDPTYMPVIRDLSPLKQHVILSWLDNPLYDIVQDTPVATEPTCIPPRRGTVIPEEPICPALHLFNSQPTDPFYDYYNDILISPNPQPQCQWQMDALFSNCTIETLRDHVQQAIELEFATIPLYMTTLYSIVEGCNNEVYSLIRGVLMQEMLHMAQVTNILIALGGTPIIDSNDTAPSYPHVGLPGCVLPNLTVTLEKASLEHIRNVFMGVEFPHETEVALNLPDFMNSTIGQFYKQMNDCISDLSDRDPNLFNDSRTSMQVQWPWNNTYGTLHVVHDYTSAMDAIHEITEQGEGASPTNPDAARDELAHFYKLKKLYVERFLS